MRFCITQFPLHAAAKNGNLAWLRSLLEKKLRIEEKNDQGWTPLHHAASNGNVDIVQFLVEEMNANFESRYFACFSLLRPYSRITCFSSSI
mmetsp:Transcript_38486/g.62549  ORF Transcript_38486/g.62549 Transcript_38486/m.62549 type:complete len:91 (-) Transcript_38486:110-382(-)